MTQESQCELGKCPSFFSKYRYSNILLIITDCTLNVLTCSWIPSQSLCSIRRLLKDVLRYKIFLGEGMRTNLRIRNPNTSQFHYQNPNTRTSVPQNQFASSGSSKTGELYPAILILASVLCPRSLFVSTAVV